MSTDVSQNSTIARSSKNKFQNWLLIIITIIFALTLVAGLWFFFQRQSQEIYTKKSDELKSIATLKVNQIIQWRHERISDAKIYTSDLILSHVTQSLVANPDDSIALNQLKIIFATFIEHEGYANVFLTTADGNVICSVEEMPKINAQTKDAIKLAGSEKQTVFGEIFVEQDTNQVYLDVVSPIINDNGSITFFLGLRINPEEQLFPIIQSWPTPSQSAETLILRKDGDHIVFLNNLRHNPAKPLTLIVPLSETNVPAVQAAMGTTGTFEGIDYRGVQVLSEIIPIEDSNWYMISKVDKSEILAEIQNLENYVFFMMAISILFAIAFAAYIYNYRQHTLYRNLFNAESQQVEAQEETRTTLYSIGDGVITTDALGMITRINPVAEQLTGWSEKEALGKPLLEVFKIINENTRLEVENPVVHVLREGLIVGLANHTLLIDKDGVERPIADSGAPIRNKNGEIIGVVMVFRDQTKERAAQKERMLLSDTISASLNEIYIFDANTLHFRFVNKSALNNLGYTLNQINQLTPLDLKPEYTLKSYHALIQDLLDGKKEKEVFETVQKRSNGTVYPVEVHLQLIQHESEKVFLAVIQDITEKKKAQTKIRDTEEQYSHLFTEMDEGFAVHQIVLDDAGNAVDYIFLDVNPAFEKLTGLKKENLIGHPVTEVMPNTEQYWIETYGRVALERIAVKFENYAAELGKWYSVSAFSPKAKQFATIFVDITERKKNEKMILESEQKFRSLFETMAQGVIYQNADGTINLANKAALQMLGLSKDQLLGRTSYDPRWQAIHEDGTVFPGEEHPAMQAFTTGKEIRNIVMGVYSPQRGSHVWININAIPQFHPGENKPFQIFTTLEDITEQKQIEKKLKQQLDELRRWNAVTLGRETRILELKKEVNEALEKAGYPPKYSVREDEIL